VGGGCPPPTAGGRLTLNPGKAVSSSSDERRAEQEARAYEIAQQLAGDRVTHTLVRAILALVQAVERGDTATSTGSHSRCPPGAAGERSPTKEIGSSNEQH
jgi:hypothetical protein